VPNLLDELIPRRELRIAMLAPINWLQPPAPTSTLPQMPELIVRYKGYSAGQVELEFEYEGQRVSGVFNAQPLRCATWADVARWADELFNADDGEAE
jgi:hypothetical protein